MSAMMASPIVVAMPKRAVATVGGSPAAATVEKKIGKTAVMIDGHHRRVGPVVHRPGAQLGSVEAEA